MSAFEIIDLLARGGALSLLALWSWLLIRDKWEALAARLAVAMNAAIACHIIATISEVADEAWYDAPLAIGAGLVAPLFWLFARAWFDDRSRVGRLGWAALAVMAITTALHQVEFDQPTLLVDTSLVVFRILQAVFALAGLYVAWSGRENDLVEARRRFRLSLIVAVGALIMMTNMIEMLAYNEQIPMLSRSFIEFGIMIVAFGFCAAMFGIRQADLLGAPDRPQSEVPLVTQSSDPLAATIETAMAEQMLYRDEKLTIAALASTLGEQEYRIRRTINGTLGHRNFARFVNSYRLGEIKAALADPSQCEVPILTIALDAGFGSLGPFNRAFRDVEAMTPTQYRKAKLADSEIG
ncbi:AraC family transcriptional regulator [Altererythrobacter sp. ZODW24]|uniref:AraC family transcriptional regulator n=1 Tax=Altererythrobacter sp. ZODW24 TaxID=2185142 RepID=UPI000DF77E89|nr:AraC family transcriptional regulator [Altererythrobacter sp. ZODW24]